MSPLVVAVGRLVPVKRFHLLIDALVAMKYDHPAPGGGDCG
jgi:glycosyltransferase involved in cell wall biosynthesis